MAACSDSEPATSIDGHSHGTEVDPASVMGVPDRPVTGPQGAVGQFVVECAFSHALSDDPIVYPGEPGMSHLHVFFGNTMTNADSQPEYLLDGDTTCEQSLDTASYWAPALLDANGQLIEPEKSVAYYRAGLDVEPTAVEPFPFGLYMIAGDASAIEAQPTSVVAWSCGSGGMREVLPPECPRDRGLRIDVTFPDCWDGEHLDVAGHRAHMHYSSGGNCPESHPVHVPQLIFSVAYGFSGDPSGLRLASGGLLTGHADFVNAWNQERLTTEVELCLHRDVVCGVTSGRISG